MKLNKIVVNNHSRIADIEIDVREHLVLVGPNDSGKSSLLRCLDLLLGSSVAQLYSRLSASDFRDQDQPLLIEARLGDFDDREKALFPDEITVNPLDQSASLLIRLTATADTDGSLSIDRRAPEGGTEHQITRDQFKGIGWTLLGATSSSRELRDDRRSAVDDILQAVDLGNERQDFDDLVENLQSLLDGSATLNTLKGRLSDQLTKALPEAVAEDDLVFEPGASTNDDVLSDVRLRVKKAGVSKSLTEQSDGTRALYAIALYDLVSENASIVGIDEPEVHLHPASQRSLARLLQGSTNQKLLATHSSDIVGAFQPECIVAFRKDGSVKQPPAGFLDANDRDAVRWWVPNRLEPLTARRIVAVEGISDRILVHAASEATGKNLDQLGVSVVEAGGAGDAGPIYRLFGPPGFDVPLSLLIDEDAKTKTATAINVAEQDLQSHSVWVVPKDLEEEYVTAIGAAACWAAIQDSGRFSRNELSNCAASAQGVVPTVQNIAAFCRRKSSYKVLAAMCVAPLLTASVVAKMPTISGLLEEAVL